MAVVGPCWSGHLGWLRAPATTTDPQHPRGSHHHPHRPERQVCDGSGQGRMGHTPPHADEVLVNVLAVNMLLGLSARP
eukprot:6752284-Prymnesium_polylepis.1